MKMSDNILKTAAEYFEAYKSEQVLYIATDGQVFLHANYNDAVNHQRQFKDKNVDNDLTTVRRSDIGKEITGNTEERVVPDETWKNPDILAWLNERGVNKPGNTKKADLLEEVAKLLEGIAVPDESWTNEQLINWLSKHAPELVVAGESTEDLLTVARSVAEELAEKESGNENNN